MLQAHPQSPYSMALYLITMIFNKSMMFTRLLLYYFIHNIIICYFSGVGVDAVWFPSVFKDAKMCTTTVKIATFTWEFSGEFEVCTHFGWPMLGNLEPQIADNKNDSTSENIFHHLCYHSSAKSFEHDISLSFHQIWTNSITSTCQMFIVALVETFRAKNFMFGRTNYMKWGPKWVMLMFELMIILHDQNLMFCNWVAVITFWGYISQKHS